MRLEKKVVERNLGRSIGNRCEDFACRFNAAGGDALLEIGLDVFKRSGGKNTSVGIEIGLCPCSISAEGAKTL